MRGLGEPHGSRGYSHVGEWLRMFGLRRDGLRQAVRSVAIARVRVRRTIRSATHRDGVGVRRAASPRSPHESVRDSCAYCSCSIRRGMGAVAALARSRIAAVVRNAAGALNGHAIEVDVPRMLAVPAAIPGGRTSRTSQTGTEGSPRPDTQSASRRGSRRSSMATGGDGRRGNAMMAARRSHRRVDGRIRVGERSDEAGCAAASTPRARSDYGGSATSESTLTSTTAAVPGLGSGSNVPMLHAGCHHIRTMTAELRESSVYCTNTADSFHA